MTSNPFVNLHLDPEEQAIEDDIEQYVVDFDEKAKQELLEAARNTLNKTRNINVRVSEKDVLKLKSIAADEGIPYQTLVTSLIHKFVSGRVVFD